MLFHSDLFIFLFLPVVWLGWAMLRSGSNATPQQVWLLVASGIFYAWWNPALLPLLLGSILVNFLIGRLCRQAEGLLRRVLVVIGVSFNLLLLGFFKYTNFLIDTVNDVGGWQFPTFTIVLPLAISFFTFQQVAYLVDTYRGRAGSYSLLHYALFVSFFPQLIAGPIVQHDELIPQFAGSRSVNHARHLAIGFTIFVLGLCKKVILADSLGRGVDPVFTAAAAGQAVSSLEAWTATLGFTLQIYFDFSSYSDMAIGLGQMFGILLPVNFESPLKATSLSELWRRWHITLSRFLGEYLFRPLGGMSRQLLRRCGALLLTMVLCGLWHGAGWTFVLWGFVQGVILVAEHAWRSFFRRRSGRRVRAGLGMRWLQTAVTVLLFSVAAVLFRAETLAAAGSVYAALLNLPSAAVDSIVLRQAAIQVHHAVIWPLMGLAIVWLCPNTQQIMGRFRPALNYHYRPSRSGLVERLHRFFQWRPSQARAALSAILFVAAISAMSRAREFIYFRF